MNLTTTTPIIVNGKLTRLLSHTFNQARKKAEKNGCELVVFYGMEEDTKVIPSKGLSWSAVAAQVRAGKKVVARLDAPKK